MEHAVAASGIIYCLIHDDNLLLSPHLQTVKLIAGQPKTQAADRSTAEQLDDNDFHIFKY